MPLAFRAIFLLDRVFFFPYTSQYFPSKCKTLIKDIGLTIKAGHRVPLTWGALGKAIAAFLSDSDKKRILSGEQVDFPGEPPRFDRDHLEQEPARGRQTGFAVDRGEMKNGIQALAWPVFGPIGKLVGSMVVRETFPKQLAER